MQTSVTAAFDFDGTLTRKHSLRPFVREVVGTRRFASGMLRSAPWLVGSTVGVLDRGSAKARFLRTTIGGRTRSELEAAGQQFASHQLTAMVRPEMAARVREHRRRGHALVLVSASLDTYLVPWATRAGFDTVLATELEFIEEHFSGRLATPNCWGKEKARRLQEWLATRQPTLLYAYGDSRADRQMLALADKPWMRSKGALPSL